MGKFLNRKNELVFLPKRLSGYVSPDGRVYLTDSGKLFLKRAFDIVFSILFLVFVMSWLFPLISLLIKLESPGRVLFRQRKHGKGNKEFFCYKFRTRLVNQEGDAKLAINDNRLTKLGSFLRRTYLDEVPQFINVLKGEMSVIGPRPHSVPMNNYFAEEVDNYRFRHQVKPGITGLAQSKAYVGEIMVFFDIYGRVKLDHFYIKKWCLILDLKILFWTFKSVFLNKKTEIVVRIPDAHELK
ncbi:MAG: sugar transferase [Cyclobacteriaceae bacterium]